MKPIAVLLLALLFAVPSLVLAQEQKGSIEGVVKDQQGAILPGVTVQATSASGIALTTTSDANGTYRFPAVSVGTYTVTAKLSGFKPGKVESVAVTIESIKKVDFSLQIGTLSEQLTVTGATPLVDVRSAERSTIIHGGDQGLPTGRDFTTLLGQAPGVNFETKSGGTMIDGAAAAENRYVIDGMETTDIIHGQSGKNLLTDFVDEIQVKSTGYAAEFGGATGGVINVITKSGTNKLSGNFLDYYQGSRLQGAPNQTLRRLLSDASKAEYVTYPKDKVDRNEVGGSVGGPILANKAWYFAAYQPSMTKTTRNVTSDSSGNPSATPSTTTNKDQVQYLTATQTTQMGSKLRTRVSFNNSWEKTEGQLATLAGTDKAGVDYSKGTRLPNYSISGTADYVVNPNFVLGARLGRYLQDAHDFNVQNVVLFNFGSTSNVGMAGVPANLQHGTGYTNVPSNSGIDHDTRSRNYFQFDATYYLHGAGGDHSIKGGVQVDRRAENIISGNLQNVINLNWGASCGPNSIQGTFGCYEVRSNKPSPRQGIITQGDVHSNVNGLFIQDTWRASDRITISGGIRTENENVPAYTTATGVTPNPIKFGFADKVAPRLGFAYDVKGDGRYKLYASWGVFYDIFKLELPQGSFGGQKWISYYYTLDTPNFETLRDSPDCPPACPGTPSTPASIDFRAVSVTPGLDIEPNLKPMRSQEFSTGFEHQFSNLLAGSIRYVHKRLDRAIDDVGDIGPEGEVYIIGNPGFGVTTKYDITSLGLASFSPQGATQLTQTMPKAKRTYDSVEFALRRNFSHNYQVNASYMWSRLFGNYSGLSQSDENGRSDPNVGRDFDYPSMMFDGSGKPLDGPLNTDRPHQVKVQFLYMAKWGTQIGLNEFVSSGIPVSRQVNVIPGDNYPIFYRGRGSDGRTPVFSQTDIQVQHAFKVGGGRTIVVLGNVLNLFNQRTVTDIFANIRRTGGVACSGAVAGAPNCTSPLAPNTYSEQAFYAGQINWDAAIANSVALKTMTLEPRFLMDNAYQNAPQARFGVKFNF